MRYISAFFYIFIFSASCVGQDGLSEVSGITWNTETETFFAVGDEGFVYELNRDLNLIRSVRIGSYDLEAITFDSDRNKLYCLDERNLSLIELDPQTFLIQNLYPLMLKIEKKRKYSQFESLVYVDGVFYLAASTREKKKKKGTLFSVTLDDLRMIPQQDFPLWDISGMYKVDDVLYLISDEENTIARYSESEETFETLDLPGTHQEGITVTGNSDLLYINENGLAGIIHVRDFSTSD